jgi:hypothetical protein
MTSNDPHSSGGNDATGNLSSAFPHLLVHTRMNQVDLAAPICATEELGAIVCMSRKSGRAEAEDLAARFTAAGGHAANLLFDANRYSGKRRTIGADGMRTSWVRLQSNAGIPSPLTDGGYVPQGRFDALHDVLRVSADMGPHVIATLAIANQFLHKDVTRLVDAVNDAGIAVGLMVEHSNDPFGPRRNVAGLTKLLAEAEVPVALMRSDISVVGALAWGARAGAFGTATSLRHIFPVGSGGPTPAPSISALVRNTLSMSKLSKIDDAMHRLPDDVLWSCRCAVCYGRPLSWIRSENDAFRHSLSVVADLAVEVTDEQLSVIERRQLWLSICQNAQSRTFEIDAETRGAWGEPQGFLGAWTAQPIGQKVVV